MGTKCTLTCAKIFMAIFEETHIYQLIKQKGQLCLRYIDDNFSYGQFLETNYNNFISKINEVHTPLSWFLLLKKPDRKKKNSKNPYTFLRHSNNKNTYRKTFNNTLQKKKSTDNPISIKNHSTLKLLNEAFPVRKHWD